MNSYRLLTSASPPVAARRTTLALGLGLAALVAGCTDQGDPLTGGDPGPGSLGPFAAAAACGVCHPTHLAEWEMSMHAFAGSDPVMFALAEVAAAEPGEKVGDDCIRCHAPALVRQQAWVASLPPEIDPGPLPDLTTDGINCDVCHSVEVVPPVADIDYLDEVDPNGPKFGGIHDPVHTTAHASSQDNSYATSISCAPCHQVNLNDGTGLENTFQEWEDSFLSGFGQECQTCHMPEYTGSAALDGPSDRIVHRHFFVGVDYAWEDFRGIDRNAQLDMIRDLLRKSVTVTAPSTLGQVAAGSTLSFSLTVTNDRTGHSIPSGTSFSREMWIEVRVTDGAGATIYHSGRLEGNGDLVSLADDPDLEFFGSTMYDANDDPTFFTWRAESIDESLMLARGEARNASYDVPVSTGTVGPLTVDVTLRFRPQKPEVLRLADLERLLPVEIFDMWTVSYAVTVTP